MIIPFKIKQDVINGQFIRNQGKDTGYFLFKRVVGTKKGAEVVIAPYISEIRLIVNVIDDPSPLDLTRGKLGDTKSQ